MLITRVIVNATPSTDGLFGGAESSAAAPPAEVIDPCVEDHEYGATPPLAVKSTVGAVHASDASGGEISSGQGAQYGPPQSIPSSPPFCTPSLQVVHAQVIVCVCEVVLAEQDSSYEELHVEQY